LILLNFNFWKNNYFLLILATCLWGGNFVMGKALAGEVPPITLSLLRWITALLVLGPFYGKMVWENRRVYKNNWRMVTVLAMTGVAGFNTLVYIAVQYTSSINASLMNSTTPITILLFSIFFLREKFSILRSTGILLSLCGVLWIISYGSFEVLMGLRFNKGDLWMLLAVILWSFYSIAVKKSSGLFPSHGIFTITIAISVLLLFPLSAVELFVYEREILLSWSVLWGVLYFGIFASVVAFTSWNLAVSRLGPSRSASFLNLIPLFSAVFATLFIGEQIHMYHFIGAFLVISGVYISTRFDSIRNL
jgi:drug/metabolite transporter (DMT)-like permease